jgi:hypothetical protein
VAVPVVRGRQAGRPSAVQASRLAGRLTERDRRIALDCYDHRVLTTDQLARLHFNSRRVAQRRLGQLHELRALERFRPVWQHGEGSTPYHWVLDTAGAVVVAELLDIAVDQLSWRRDHAYQLASSSKLAHQLAVNEFFTRLHREARTVGGALVEWWGERRVAAAFAGRLQPDGYGHLQLPGSSIRFLLELDRGTEPHHRLTEKADRYQRELAHSDLADADPLILLLTPSPQRTDGAADMTASRPIPLIVSTWTPDSLTSPLALLRQAARART